MSESGDYDPGVWRGHDFSDARAAYDEHVGRSYEDAVVTAKPKEKVLEPKLITQSRAPLVVVCDVTGSMGEWPATIFSKLPYLELEGKEYLGEDMEISFGAVGDAYSDSYPLQARAFGKGLELKDRLKELVIEGGGGSDVTETYELAALYYARKVEMPNAVQPICIFIGDEQPYNFVDRDHADKYAGIRLQRALSTQQVFNELRRRYSVYLIRKPYRTSGSNTMSAIDTQIQAVWTDLLGADHIATLPEAGRVVDVIFGILARETARIEYFRKEIEARQKPRQVNTVYKSLETIHVLGAKPERKLLTDGRSIMKRDSRGKGTDLLV